MKGLRFGVLSFAANVLGICVCAFAEPSSGGGVAAPAQRRPDFIPLGVYWPGEYAFQDCGNATARWQRVDAALDDLARHHVNAIWLTHLSAAETAEFSRRAASRGLYLVASLGELAGEEPQVRKSDHAALIERTRAAWSNAPAPIAWGLGDEPRSTYMNEIAAYVQAWRTNAPGEAVTSVVMWGDVNAAGRAGFDFLCCDVYPFFSAGNPNGYGAAPFAAWRDIARNVVARGRVGWMMGQAYQEPWGPHEADAQGNVVYLPGGAPHWVMPTPEQIRWQAWSAIANGAKGVFYFAYRFPRGGNTNAAPANLPAAVKARTNSNAPRGLVYDDGRPTPQYEAMGEAFAQIAKLAPVLAPLRPAAAREVWSDGASGSAEVSMLVDPASQKRFLVVVGPYDGDAKQTLAITLGPHVTGLRNVSTGRALPLALAAPYRAAVVPVRPGEGQVFECAVDPANMPQVYSDDFATDKYKADAMNGDTTRVKRYETATGGCLSALDGGAAADQAFLVYDLDQRLGPVDPDGARMLIYSGGANPPEYRGAFWSISADGQSFHALSSNQFDRAVIFSERYLKVGLSWRQSGGPAYGHLSGFTVCQWKHAARSF